MDRLLGNIPNEYLPLIVIVITLLSVFCLAVPVILGAKILPVRRRVWCKRHQRWANIRTTYNPKKEKSEVVGCDIQTVSVSCDNKCIEEN